MRACVRLCWGEAAGAGGWGASAWLGAGAQGRGPCHRFLIRQDSDRLCEMILLALWAPGMLASHE